MIVCAAEVLLLLIVSRMEAEDPVLDVGGAFPGSGGSWDVADAAFKPEESLLLVVGAAEIDAICGSMRCLLGLCDTGTAIQI